MLHYSIVVQGLGLLQGTASAEIVFKFDNKRIIDLGKVHIIGLKLLFNEAEEILFGGTIVLDGTRCQFFELVLLMVSY
ncbi:hypothetical protein ZORO111902_02435 [Zobellia roscoffensis]